MLELSPEEWVAVHLSLKIALVATAVALPFGLALAWLLARKQFWGKALLDGLVHMCGLDPRIHRLRQLDGLPGQARQ